MASSKCQHRAKDGASVAARGASIAHSRHARASNLAHQRPTVLLWFGCTRRWRARSCAASARWTRSGWYSHAWRLAAAPRLEEVAASEASARPLEESVCSHSGGVCCAFSVSEVSLSFCEGCLLSVCCSGCLCLRGEKGEGEMENCCREEKAQRGLFSGHSAERGPCSVVCCLFSVLPVTT